MTSPPLLLITHNHAEPVLRDFGWSTDVQVSRLGTEMRRSLRDTPTEQLTYKMTLMNQTDQTIFVGSLAGLLDMQVEFPRWEDMCNLMIDKVAGQTSLELSEDVVGRHYEFGRRVLLYRRDQPPEIRVVATSANPLIVDALVADWRAGTVIVPLEVGRVDSPVAGSDMGNFFRDPTVVMSVDEDVAGITVDTSERVMVANSIILRNSYFNSGGNIPRGGVLMVYADVWDADGILIPNPNIVWSSSGSASISVYPSGRNGRVLLRHDGSGGGASIDVTATVDGVSSTSTLSV